MKIKYFKTNNWGDCYVSGDDYMRVVSISNKDICVMACDDGNPLDGKVFKILNISKKDFEEMKECAYSKERKKLSNLLSKVHRDNKEELSSPIFNIKTKKDPFFATNYSKQTEYFRKKQAILE